MNRLAERGIAERVRTAHAQQERQMVERALRWRPKAQREDERREGDLRIAQGHMERYRVANAERLAKEGR